MIKEAHAINDITCDPVKRRAWVGYRLKAAGTSLAAIAREAGLTRNAAYNALDTKRTTAWPRMDLLIAEAVGLSVQELFPERYTKEGLPKRGKPGRPRKGGENA
jgi:Ner family transcriptional regulator